MVIEQKAIVGKLKTFPSRIQQLFAVGSNSRSCEQTELFHRLNCPFDCKDGKDSGCTCGRKPNSETKCLPLSQTYPQWKVMCDVQKLHSFQKRKRFRNRIVYVLALGTLKQKGIADCLVNDYHQENGLASNCCSSLLNVVMKMMGLFFYGMEVKLLAFQDIDSLGFTMRVHSKTNRNQVLVTGM